MVDSQPLQTVGKPSKTDTPPIANPVWHVLSIEAVADTLQTDGARGLTQADAGAGATTLNVIDTLLVAATGIAFAMGDNLAL